MSGITSNSVYSEEPQLEQNQCTFFLPESPTAAYDLGSPLTTLKSFRGTTELEVKAAPLHF